LNKDKDYRRLPENSESRLFPPQIKICGLTRVEEAVACASLDVDALGFVFYPKSPRAVTIARVREIAAALPSSVCRIGVFVDESYETIITIARASRLHAVQLHGHESAELVKKLRAAGLTVIKTLFIVREPFLTRARHFPAAKFLVECGAGPLPGGNARAWDFSLLETFGKKNPLILAGGLTIDNVSEAVLSCRPDAVDISSGVEFCPGRKDLKKVKSFIQAVQCMRTAIAPRRIFYVNQ
jgi:phosphoribosylanthranilate isomerase